MIRYDVALTIIGVIVTVMGILIAFEITFPATIYYDVSERLFQFLYEYDLEMTTKGIVLKEMRQYRRGVEGRVRTELKRFKIIVITIFAGLIIIGVLIFQTYTWEIDPQTNLISQENFFNLNRTLLFAFVWIITSILIFLYSYILVRFKYVLKQFEKIDSFERKHYKNEK